MKQLLFISLWAFVLISCQPFKKEAPFAKTIVCGVISNFDKSEGNDIIEMSYHHIISRYITTAVEVDEEGKFHLELEHDIPVELIFNWNKRLSFYINPGDSLNIKIDGSCIDKKLNSNTEILSYYKITSTSQKMCEDVASYTAFFKDSLRDIARDQRKIKECSIGEYKEYLDSLHQTRSESVHLFNEKNNTCEQFKAWVENELKYEKWFHLVRYSWLNPSENGKDMLQCLLGLPTDYFDFVNLESTSFHKDMESKYYMGVLDEYAKNIKIITGYSLKEAGFNSGPSLFVDSLINIFKEVEEPLESDILILNLYNEYLDNGFFKLIKDCYDSTLIQNDYLRTNLNEKFNYKKNLFENPEFAEGSNINQLASENEVIQELVAKYPDKVLYLDFWAPWCGPCMGEMKPAKAIKSRMKDKDVVFVYLGCRCEESAWKSTIAEKKITGEHYHLSKAQYNEMKELLGIKGIPHFALIDRDGKIAEPNTLRPSSGDKLVEKLESYLK